MRGLAYVFRFGLGVALAAPAASAQVFPPYPDDEWQRQWALHNTGQQFGVANCGPQPPGCGGMGTIYQSMVGTNNADINAPTGWQQETGSADVIVAVIDTGADRVNVNLTNALWSAPDEVPGTGTPGVDDDGNGYIDDWWGYDTCSDIPNPAPPAPNDPCYGEDADPSEVGKLGTGTHLAGIIGARPDSHRGTTGLAWGGVRILPVKAFDDDFNVGGTLPGQGQPIGTCASVAKAIDYAVDNDVRIILLGWVFADRGIGNCGTGNSGQVYDALVAARAAGILVVAAAGDDGANINGVNDATTKPGSYNLDNIITVGASTPDDTLATVTNTTGEYDNTYTGTPPGADGTFHPQFDAPFGTNYGNTAVDLAAPGVAILSTLPGTNNPNRDRGYGGGTGQAAAFVAGTAALIWSTSPLIDYLTVKNRILDTVDPIGSMSGQLVTGGRLDAAQALPGECADGLDNDGDGDIDYGEDPGCPNGHYWVWTEDPECQDGIDNDGDLKVDFDGGASMGGSGIADPQCGGFWDGETGCGIGFELAFVLPPLMLWRARKARRSKA